MYLKKYDNQYVRIIDNNDDLYEGVAHYNSRDYNLHEFDKDEEGLELLNCLFVISDIKSIRKIHKLSGYYGKIEEMIVEDGLSFIEDVMDSFENDHIYRLLLCLESKFFEISYRKELIEFLSKVNIEDEKIQSEIKKLIRMNSPNYEVWDLYDHKGNVSGLKHIRGDELPDSLYHLVVHVWIKNKDGKFLISRRSASRKSYPLYYECVGGSVLHGETSLMGALRETHEEVGIKLNPKTDKVIYRKVRKKYHGEKFNDIMDVHLFHYDGPVNLNKATTDEVCEVAWMSIKEIKKLFKEKKLVPTLEYIFKYAKEDI